MTTLPATAARRYSADELDELKAFPPALQDLWLPAGWTIDVYKKGGWPDRYNMYDSTGTFVAGTQAHGSWYLAGTHPSLDDRGEHPGQIVYEVMTRPVLDSSTHVSPTGLEDVPTEELQDRETDPSKWLEAIELQRRGEPSRFYGADL